MDQSTAMNELDKSAVHGGSWHRSAGVSAQNWRYTRVCPGLDQQYSESAYRVDFRTRQKGVEMGTASEQRVADPLATQRRRWADDG